MEATETKGKPETVQDALAAETDGDILEFVGRQCDVWCRDPKAKENIKTIMIDLVAGLIKLKNQNAMKAEMAHRTTIATTEAFKNEMEKLRVMIGSARENLSKITSPANDKAQDQSDG